jgi:hypothetical protein
MVPRTAPRIMVIGFDANFCYLMQRFGRVNNHPLVFADPNQDIIDQTRKNQPTVIFLEAAQPGNVANALICDLKNQPDTRLIPVVICYWQEEVISTLQSCADIYLRLPILFENYTAVLAQVEKAVEGDG